MPVRIDLTANRLAPVLPLPVLRDIERRHADEPLMDRAGSAAADIASAMLARHRGPVAVLAGPGNNGGDACVCARRLHASGFDVTVACAADPARLASAAAAAYAEASAAGVRFVPAPPSRRPALVVDGLFGIGLSRPVAAPYDQWIEWANAQAAPILALDVPSGLDAATGVAHRPTIAAAATATFIALKPGLLTCDGPDHCGELSVHGLGLDLTGVAAGARLEWRPLSRDLPAILARRTRKTHKGTFGRACVIGGAEGLVGAALLAGRAAIRLGAGRVVVGLAARNPPLVDWASPELMLRDATSVGEDYDAWVVGPGLGAGERAHAIAAKAAGQAQPIVLDADALNAVAVDATLRDAVARRTSPTLATPHPAEAARLLRCDTAAVQADRVGAAIGIASALRAHVVLKGVGSIVARPDGSFDVNASGNPALATAGSGDVLAGILGALLAQGIAAEDVLRIGVCVHGAAADALVAEGIGPLGVTASELIDAARALLNEATRKPAKR
ncbi:MAG TPA: NAD(P)H-hydrate dehydratase [Casimicrobiaceae bacterium]|nr:NAD(P)H-hydrate dehydratase [Casimicrobiaceae bacterium]